MAMHVRVRSRLLRASEGLGNGTVTNWPLWPFPVLVHKGVGIHFKPATTFHGNESLSLVTWLEQHIPLSPEWFTVSGSSLQIRMAGRTGELTFRLDLSLKLHLALSRLSHDFFISFALKIIMCSVWLEISRRMQMLQYKSIRWVLTISYVRICLLLPFFQDIVLIRIKLYNCIIV